MFPFSQLFSPISLTISPIFSTILSHFSHNFSHFLNYSLPFLSQFLPFSQLFSPISLIISPIFSTIHSHFSHNISPPCFLPSLRRCHNLQFNQIVQVRQLIINMNWFVGGYTWGHLDQFVLLICFPHFSVPVVVIKSILSPKELRSVTRTIRPVNLKSSWTVT